MGFFKKIIGIPDAPVKNYTDFWNWFVKNEKELTAAVRSQSNIDKKFLETVSSKLNELKDGFYFSVNVDKPHRLELTFTADGAVENFAFIEDLVAAAPVIPGWTFTAFKQPHLTEEIRLEYSQYFFNDRKLFFVPVTYDEYPDLIEIKLVYTDTKNHDEQAVRKGILLYLEYLIGEIRMATVIDELKISFQPEQESDLIPIAKLNDYLTWREKEFIEKYDGIKTKTAHDEHVVAEASDSEDRPFFCLFNKNLVDWDRKASHPWIVQLQIGFDGRKNHGLPDDAMSEFMGKFEEELMHEMKDENGYLYVARITGNDVRNIFFACKEFRLPSKILAHRKHIYKGRLKLEFWIFKDKYWNFLHEILPE